MNLTFLGRGSAFNTKEGNTSAYFTDNNDLFLIDCGENIFSQIIKKDILKNINSINVLITHTHPDHIGSLGTLIFYVFFALNKKVNIILPTNPKYLNSIKNILTYMGCNEDKYTLSKEVDYDNFYKSFNTIRFIETKHSIELDCYSIIIETNNGLIYYSGDTSETKTLEKIINSNKKIDKLYIETTSFDYPENPHLYIRRLKEIIPNNLKVKVYCMHLNNNECINQVLNAGFKVVEI